MSVLASTESASSSSRMTLRTRGVLSVLYPTPTFSAETCPALRKDFFNNSKWMGNGSPARLMSFGTLLSAPQKIRTRARPSVFLMQSTNVSSHKQRREAYGPG